MTQYRATTESGHLVIIHGARERRNYELLAQNGEAEPLSHVEAIDLRQHRDEHKRLCDLGQCYGPCSLAQ